MPSPLTSPSRAAAEAEDTTHAGMLAERIRAYESEALVASQVGVGINVVEVNEIAMKVLDLVGGANRTFEG